MESQWRSWYYIQVITNTARRPILFHINIADGIYACLADSSNVIILQ